MIWLRKSLGETEKEKGEKRRGTVDDIFYCVQENVAGCSRKNVSFTAEKGLGQTLSDNTEARVWKLLSISQLLHESCTFIVFTGQSVAKISVIVAI